MSILKIENLSQRYGDKVLYQETGLELNAHEHVGLIGENGAGKSTLIEIARGEMEPDGGKVFWQAETKVGYLDQYAKLDGEVTILEYIQNVHKELYKVARQVEKDLAQIEKVYDEKLLQRILREQQILSENNFVAKEVQGRKVTAGLGLAALGWERKAREMSGGQRAKLLLAKLLLENPDVLLLDEPTNFLDKEHIDWLAEYLHKFAGAILLISHDTDFLDKVVEQVTALEGGKIRKYKGNYTAYKKQKALEKVTQSRAYDKQQKLIAKTQDYIARNGVRTATARQAQSRQKMLDKIQLIAPPENKKKLPWRFASGPAVGGKALTVQDLIVGYEKPLLPPLNLEIRAGEKIAIIGFNGIGKSTLLKTLLGEIPALGGKGRFAEGTTVNYFEQELKWMDPRMTPIQIVWESYPDLTQSEVRAKLAQSGVKKDLVNSRIASLSGGEQTKVKMAKMMLRRSNFLILDEPTNHLDVVAKESLQRAIAEFVGTVILVSHEESFYAPIVEKVHNLQFDQSLL